MSKNINNLNAIDEYKSIITMRMLLYRVIGDSLKAYHEENLDELYMLLTRVPKNTAEVVSESLMIPSFKDFYSTWLVGVREEKSSLAKKMHQIIGPRAKCSLDNYKKDIGYIGKRVAELAGIEVREKEEVNLIGLIEFAYTLLWIEYSALDEYNITPMISLETELVLNKIVPCLINLAKCLEENSSSIEEVKLFVQFLKEFALVEKSIAEAQQKALLSASRQQRGS